VFADMRFEDCRSRFKNPTKVQSNKSRNEKVQNTIKYHNIQNALIFMQHNRQ
jgi:hypothetical protein